MAEILVVVVLFIALQTPGSDFKEPEPVEHGEPIFTIDANKQELEQLINQEVSASNKQSNLTYQIHINDDAKITGKLNVLSANIPFEMTFAPTVKDGNVLLKEKSVKLGVLKLPPSEVLKFINKGTDLPEWVHIDDDKEQIYINLTQLKIKDRFYLQAEAIDLANNQIQFNVFHE